MFSKTQHARSPVKMHLRAVSPTIDCLQLPPPPPTGLDGTAGSRVTQGSLSSIHIAFAGGNGRGSSSVAIATSTLGQSGASSKRVCVPQQAAKLLNRPAHETRRSVPETSL